MKKLLILFFVLTFSISSRSQSYLGYYHDNYSGTQGVLFNPANVVDSPFRLDVNLVSGSLFGSNDYYGVKFTDVLKNGYDFENEAKKNPMSSNNAYINVDTQGLSFLFNVSPKHSLGLYTRGRAIINANELNGKLFSEFDNEFIGSEDYTIDEGNFNMTGNSWAELGLTYGAVLLNKGKHFLKGGITAKYLQGLANTYANGKNFSIVYDADSPILGSNQVTANGEIIYGGTNDFDESAKNFDFNSKSRGFGADLGLVYEWRPEGKVDLSKATQYKLKFGLSITDIGSLKFKDDKLKRYVFNNVTVNSLSLQGKDFEETLLTFDSSPEEVSSVKAVLPTALHISADWNFYKKFFLNVNGDLGLTSKNALNKNFNPSIVAVTPRYESKWFGVYLPLNYSDYREFQTGLGFRAGPLFVGSGSIITNLLNEESKGLDAYFGLKIPIYKGKAKVKTETPPPAPVPTPAKIVEKDSDNDGILDRDDQCPTVAGPTENKGCPYKDADNDGVLDKDDQCPTVAGPKENTGCPWPDTDGDGLLDKDDKCPDVKGTLRNNGCPEVTDAVIKKLNDYAKTILFDSGKATFQERTYPVLQAMLAILKEYPNSKFSIEGHTDSDGATAANQTLSENRAAAVMSYLVENGIEALRLSSKGFGETKPIATNNTKAGKALNRRVEVKLQK